MHNIYTLSMVVPLVPCGGLSYADRIPCESSDPLAILIAAEDGEEQSGYPAAHDVIWHYQAVPPVA